MPRFLFVSAFIFLITVGLHSDAYAKVRQVGPTSFHKQIEIPRSLGRNDGFNNDESYSKSNTHRKRQDRRKNRDRRRAADSEESRTQPTEKASRQKRQGRRERQTNARQQRMQERQLQKFITDKADAALNE